jgi:hypothetical protein
MKDYQKYKWFFTSTKKLVIGGKSASQNDELLSKIKSSEKDFVVMHTTEPGSPFTVIIANPNDLVKEDYIETAHFTAAFSRAWRSLKSTTTVDKFMASQLSKPKSAKTGTWTVKPPIQHKDVQLSLVLTRQNGILRAVPESTIKNSEALIKVKPGNIDKMKMLPKIKEIIPNTSDEEILSALPAGGVEIVSANPNKAKTTKGKKTSKKKIKKKR